MKQNSRLSDFEIANLIKKYDEVLKDKGEEEADKIFDNVPIPSPKTENRITNKELLNTVQTGDIILWSGSSGISKKIRLSSHSPFSHATIVFKGALDEEEATTSVINIPRIFQSTWSEFDQDIHGKHGKVSRQVMLNDLSLVLSENEQEQEPATLRSLNCSEEQRKACTAMMAKFVNETDGDNYPGAVKGIPDFSDISKGLKGIRIDHPIEFICSELVAAALQAMGVIDSEKAVNWYAPADFSDEGYSKFQLRLKKGFGFGPEQFVSG